MSNVIELENVTKEYRMGPNRIMALDGLSMAIPAGSMATVIGPSGSGKSTLLNIPGALDRPTSGKVSVEGVDLSHLSETQLTAFRRGKVGFVFQDFGLIPNLSALENVMLPMDFARVPRRESRCRARELLEAVNMSHRARHRPSRLSGGEQQRIAIARALANNPAIILADEPTGNLDAETSRQVIDLLAKFVREKSKTVIVVTHDAHMMQEADLKLYLRDGRISQH